jgi:hypothetical protein
MSTFSGSPRLLKGAIIGVDPLNPLASIVIFQYNPKKVTRRLAAQAAGACGGGFGQTAPAEALRLASPSDETLKPEDRV